MYAGRTPKRAVASEALSTISVWKAALPSAHISCPEHRALKAFRLADLTCSTSTPTAQDGVEALPACCSASGPAHQYHQPGRRTAQLPAAPIKTTRPYRRDNSIPTDRVLTFPPCSRLHLLPKAASSRIPRQAMTARRLATARPPAGTRSPWPTPEADSESVPDWPRTT